MSSMKGRGSYKPRRSQHVSNDVTPSDGDVWHEKMAVCEGTTPTGEPKLIIRSFYRNKRSGERVWDEPPSGASSVVHATCEMRKKAELQKEELQLTLEMIPPEIESSMASATTSKDSKNEKSGFLGRFRSKKNIKKEVETSKDLNLQRAIAMSLVDQSRGHTDQPIIHYDGEDDGKYETYNDVDDDEIALAKALSLSVNVTSSPVERHLDESTEEEMFQRALKQSQEDSNNFNATGVASLPRNFEDSDGSMSLLTMAVIRPNVVGKRDPNESIITVPK